MAPTNEFVELAAALRPRMLSAARRVGLSKDEAIGVVDSLLWERLVHTAPRLEWKTPNDLRGYFYTAARNAALDYLRQEIARRRLEGAYVERQLAEQGVDSRARIEKQVLVHKALNMMPQFDAEIAWRLYALEFSAMEIAEDLGWSIHQLKWHIRRNVRPALTRALISVGAHLIA